MRPVDRIPAYADAIDGTARCHTSAGEPKVLPPTPETRVRNARAASLPREMVVCVTQRRKKKKRKKKARQASAMASSRIRDYSGVGFGFHERCEDTMEAHRGLRRIIYTPRRLARGRKKIISGALGCRNQARRRRCA